MNTPTPILTHKRQFRKSGELRRRKTNGIKWRVKEKRFR